MNNNQMIVTATGRRSKKFKWQQLVLDGVNHYREGKPVCQAGGKNSLSVVCFSARVAYPEIEIEFSCFFAIENAGEDFWVPILANQFPFPKKLEGHVSIGSCTPIPVSRGRIYFFYPPFHGEGMNFFSPLRMATSRVFPSEA